MELVGSRPDVNCCSTFKFLKFKIQISDCVDGTWFNFIDLVVLISEKTSLLTAYIPRS